MKKLLICGLTLALAACTTMSPVTQVGADTYRVRAGNWGGFRTNDEMLEDAGQAADDFCAKRGDRAEVFRTRPGYYEAAAALTFRCVAR